MAVEMKWVPVAVHPAQWLPNVGVQLTRFLISHIFVSFSREAFFSPPCLCTCYLFLLPGTLFLQIFLWFFTLFRFLYKDSVSPQKGLPCVLCKIITPSHSLFSYSAIFLFIKCTTGNYNISNLFIMFFPLEHVLCEGKDLVCPLYCCVIQHSA